MLLRRLLFLNFYVVYRADRWLRVRLTAPGMLVAGTAMAAGVFSINTRVTLSYQLLTFAVGLLAVAVLAAPWFRGRFRVRRHLPRYATVDQPLRYTVSVTNEGPRRQRGLWLLERLDRRRPDVEELLSFRDPEDEARNWFDRHVGYYRWSGVLRRRRGASVREQALPDLPSGIPCRVEAELVPVRRGRVMLDGVWLLRPDPLGLFRARIWVGEPDAITVLPRRYPVSWAGLLGRHEGRPGGASESVATGGADEFAALREYRPGDPLRHIDWKGWARLGTPIVKEFHELCFARQALVLDTFAPRGATRDAFEDAVSVAASFACAAGPAEGTVDLLFVGSGVCRVTKGPGQLGIDGLLETLACAEPCFDREFGVLRDAVMQGSGELSACVCVLLAWDEERRRLIEALRAVDVRVLVLLVSGEEAPCGDGDVVQVEPGRVGECLARLSAGRRPRARAA